MLSAFDEDDLRLLHGLQIAPRVSWAEAARILGTTPVTVAARWERLRARGLAWVFAHPSVLVGEVLTALVEVDCLPGRQAEAVATLQQDPRAVTIEQSARGRDLLLTVITRDLGSLSRYLLDELPNVPGVQRQRASLALEVHRQGKDWRLQALDRDQRAGFEAVGHHPSGARLPRDPGPIIEALGRDGRSSAADIARTTGRNPATVRRHLAGVLDSGWLAVRCEVALDPGMWGLQCMWLARVDEVEKERTVAAIATLPELRLCASTSGETNLLISVWTRSPRDLMRLERLVGERLPSMTIVESVINLRTVKRMGWFLDDRGRATGEIVVPALLGDERAGT